MTQDEREKVEGSFESLLGIHRQLKDAKQAARKDRMRLAWALAGMMTCLLVMGLYWPVQRECATLEAMGQERAGDLVVMQAVTSWYRGQVSYWEGQAARRVSAERELAEVLASRVKWNTAGNGPLDLPPLTMEQAKKRLIAYDGEPTVKEETLVEPKPVSISQRLMQAFGSETMKVMRMMVRP